jgi:hypothetical protein
VDINGRIGRVLVTTLKTKVVDIVREVVMMAEVEALNFGTTTIVLLTSK